MPDLSDLSDLAALPWQLQLVLGSGYIAYLLAFVGIRHTHKTADTVFGTLAFGLVALATLASLPDQWNALVVAAVAIAAALSAAVLWRWLIRNMLRKALHASGYSWADDTPSAWDRLLEGGYGGATQLTVELNDGRYLYCTEAQRAGEHPFGPFILGTCGDILLYVDSSKASGGEAVDHTASVFDEEWGSLLTYVPAESIRKVAIRVT